MDFEKVLEILIQKFNEKNIDFALVGGFALNLLGIIRTTQDIDFLILLNKAGEADQIMKQLNYEVLYRSEECANYVSPIRAFGRVDFMYAHRKYTRAMLKNALKVKVLNNRYEMKILRAEDIIGLKMQALSNNPERYLQDMSDIERLLSEQKELDMSLIREYFRIFEKEKELEEILRRVKNAQ